MKKLIILISIGISTLMSCDVAPTSDQKDQQKQEILQAQGSAQTGMPSIHNFQEKKMVKMLYELRDNPNLTNYVYL